MSRAEWEFACGFCRKAFRSLHGKLRHLKICKGVLPDEKRCARWRPTRRGAMP